MKTILPAIIASLTVLTVSAQNNSFLHQKNINNEVFTAASHGPAVSLSAAGAPCSMRIREFTATQKTTDVTIFFIAENEQDLTGYDIERSIDGVHFTAITSITPLNTSYSQRYQFTDKKAAFLGEKLFYRIKVSGAGYQSDYTEFVVVYVSGDFAAEISPSVVARGANIVLTVKDCHNSMEPRKVDCTDMFGRVVFSQTARPGTQVNINSSNLNNGIYLVQVANTEGGKTRLRFVVQ